MESDSVEIELINNFCKDCSRDHSKFIFNTVKTKLESTKKDYKDAIYTSLMNKFKAVYLFYFEQNFEELLTENKYNPRKPSTLTELSSPKVTNIQTTPNNTNSFAVTCSSISLPDFSSQNPNSEQHTSDNNNLNNQLMDVFNASSGAANRGHCYNSQSSSRKVTMEKNNSSIPYDVSNVLPIGSKNLNKSKSIKSNQEKTCENTDVATTTRNNSSFLSKGSLFKKRKSKKFNLNDTSQITWEESIPSETILSASAFDKMLLLCECNYVADKIIGIQCQKILVPSFLYLKMIKTDYFLQLFHKVEGNRLFESNLLLLKEAKCDIEKQLLSIQSIYNKNYNFQFYDIVKLKLFNKVINVGIEQARSNKTNADTLLKIINTN